MEKLSFKLDSELTSVSFLFFYRYLHIEIECGREINPCAAFTFIGEKQGEDFYILNNNRKYSLIHMIRLLFNSSAMPK